VSPTAFVLMVRLFRLGREVLDADGGRRVYLRTSRTQLAKLAGTSRRSIDSALAQLEQLGFLSIHEPESNRHPASFSAPFELSDHAKIAPIAESEIAHHGGGGYLNHDPLIDRSRLATTTTTPHAREENREIIASLRDLGVSTPVRWVERFGAERCEAALNVLDRAEDEEYEAAVARHMARGGGFHKFPQRPAIANPAGFMYRWLESGEPPPPPTGHDQPERRDHLDTPGGRAPVCTPCNVGAPADANVKQERYRDAPTRHVAAFVE
jgi:hypothetical protein